MNILVIFTGGTIGSSVLGSVISTDNANTFLLLDMYKRKTGREINFATVQPYYALSENNTGEQLTALTECVCNAVNENYDGIIVTHGTDTLQYSAAALSYALGAGTIPVVLVSSNYVLTDGRANGLDNFINAVNFIEQRGGRGVFVSYKNTGDAPCIHRASRLLAHSEFSDDVFSVKNQFYGYFENGIFVKNAAYTAKNDETEPFGRVDFGKSSSAIKVIQSYVGYGYPKAPNRTKAVLIKGYHSGTLCTEDDNFKSFANDLRARGIPCFICGAENKTIYESAKIFADYGIKILPVASFISQYIKLWCALAAGRDLEKAMSSSLGEDVI